LGAPALATSHAQWLRGGWNSFAWTDPVDLGAVSAGTHSLRFATDGQLIGLPLYLGEIEGL
jgi:hypothetical protein